VDEQDRLAVRVARLLEIDLVEVGDPQHAGAVRLDLRIEAAALRVIDSHGTQASHRVAGRR
jgi:hypothetical protein